MIKPLIRWGRRLTQPDVFFYCGLWMMFLLIVGTISQKYIGLYQARLKFFSSFIFWFYNLPFPGAQLAMGLILTSLVLKILYSLNSLKTKKQLSSFVMHLGVTLLLTGAFITGVFSQEGYIALEEGQSSSTILDYHKVELSVYSLKNKQAKASVSKEGANQTLIKSKLLKAFHAQSLLKNKVLTGPFPFSLKVQKFMQNAEPVFAQTPGSKIVVALKPKKLEKINEENQAGLLFQVLNQKKTTSYALFEPIPQVITITPRGGGQAGSSGRAVSASRVSPALRALPVEPLATGEESLTLKKEVRKGLSEQNSVQSQKYMIQLQPLRTYLPFSLKLIHFKKENYPGSHRARSYQSLVHILDRGATQSRLIKMNRPLRYQGYTFYQSSYIESEKKVVSVLSVVKNAGQVFPYISSLIICFSLLMYILSTLWPSSTLKFGEKK